MLEVNMRQYLMIGSAISLSTRQMFYRNCSLIALVLSLICLQVSATEAGDGQAGKKQFAQDQRSIDAGGLENAPITAPSAIRSELDEQKAGRKKERGLLELQSKRSARPGNAPCLTWLPDNGKCKAVILCVHGLGLHNGTYADFGKRMASLGYAVYAIDVRGFGSFMEAKGREKVDFDGCLNDIQSTLKVLHRAHKGLPLYLLGESMGGAIALRATAIYPDLVDGLISSVPANDRFKQSHTRLSVAVHLLENPDKPFDVGKDIISQATENQELRDQWSKDPLNKLNLSANELLQFQHFMNQNHKCAKLIEVTPVLFVQGCRDKLVKPQGTVELFNELATKDRQLDLITNGEHLIFEENQFTDEGINKVSMWIDAHQSPAASGKNAHTSSGVDPHPTSVDSHPASEKNSALNK
ncbi:hypothetical protein BH10CYA1_BH10CYA1_10210 [soil metagenome]